MKHASRLSAVILTLLILFGVLLFGISRRNFREDEGIVLESSAQDNLIHAVQRQISELQAPLYFGSAYLWQQVAGDGEFTYRVFSALTSLITLALVYRLGKRWFGGVS